MIKRFLVSLALLVGLLIKRRWSPAGQMARLIIARLLLDGWIRYGVFAKRRHHGLRNEVDRQVLEALEDLTAAMERAVRSVIVWLDPPEHS